MDTVMGIVFKDMICDKL